MDAADAKVVADFLVAELENEIPTTLGVLRAVPGNHLDYRPDSLSKTALGLLRHLALEDAWLLNCIADGEFVSPPDDSDACGVMTPADAVARYRDKVPEALKRVRELTGEQLLQQLDLLGMMQMPAINFLSVALKHSVHHRGQLSSYLRAMGGKVPEIYGPTAESPQQLAKSSAAD